MNIKELITIPIGLGVCIMLVHALDNALPGLEKFMGVCIVCGVILAVSFLILKYC